MSYYIAIEGVIGVGKTSLARYLQDELDGELILERFDENPFLSNFYADRDTYAFQTQIFFLLSRYQQQQRIFTMPRPLVSDYIFAKDLLFAQLNLEGDELATYEGVYFALAEKVPQPDLVIYLQASTDTLMKRIRLRDRIYERDMDESYIESLRVGYDKFFENYNQVPVMTISADNYDFVASQDDRFHLLESIKHKLSEQSARAKQLPSSPAEPTPVPEDFDASVANLAETARRLSDFQEFHRYLDAEKGFTTDILFNMVKLQEEVGELSKVVARHWSGLKRDEPHIALRAIKSELSDVLAYILKIANYTGIDLEEAYMAKMAVNRKRIWKSPEGN